MTAETACLVRALAAGGARGRACAPRTRSARRTTSSPRCSPRASTSAGAAGRTPTPTPPTSSRSSTACGRRSRSTTAPTCWRSSTPPARSCCTGLVGGTEETTTGLLRLRALEAEGRLACPVIAVNEARTERLFNDHYGTGQSTLDGILRATNLLLAGRTLVVLGYGFTGKGVALRARGAGAQVIVCEVDPMRALEARMEGFEVMPALEAAERGEVFVTVTGNREVLGAAHFARMKDGAVLANAGPLRRGDRPRARCAPRPWTEPREVLPLVTQYDLGRPAAQPARRRAAWSTWRRARAIRPR